MLATERSNKTFREEERKRELEERQEELARLEEERQQMEREAEGLQVAREQPHLSMVGVHIQGVEEDMAAHHDLLLEKAFSEQVYAAISQGRRHKSDVDIRVSSTQETDYGDLDVLFTTQPFRTQVFLAPRGSRAEQRGVGLGPGHASQETDYGDLDLDVAEVEKFLEQVDFSDDDYP
jgi:multidrug efflux pump subunit AcrA (membrane-fusion protein)